VETEGERLRGRATEGEKRERVQKTDIRVIKLDRFKRGETEKTSETEGDTEQGREKWRQGTSQDIEAERLAVGERQRKKQKGRDRRKEIEGTQRNRERLSVREREKE
jgi:hypothetical protein